MSDEDRTAWIRRRAEAGYDFAQLVDALARLEVTVEHPGVVIDATAIEPNPHWPPTLALRCVGGGQFLHGPSGTTATLPEFLLTVALSALDRRACAEAGR